MQNIRWHQRRVLCAATVAILVLSMASGESAAARPADASRVSNSRAGCQESRPTRPSRSTRNRPAVAKRELFEHRLQQLEAKVETIGLPSATEGWSNGYGPQLTAAVIIAVVTVFAAGLSARGLMHQLEIEALLEFTKRYAENYEKLPAHVKPDTVDESKTLSAEDRDKIWEFFFLYWLEWKVQQRHRLWRFPSGTLLDWQTWEGWLRHLARMLHDSPQLTAGWRAISNRFDDRFVALIDSMTWATTRRW